MFMGDDHRSRRTVLAGACVATAATALTACGGKADETSPASTPAADAPSADASPTALAKTADVPVGSAVIVDDVVITQPTAGVFKGFSAVCPHAGCNVSKVVDGALVCPCHGSKFDLEGAVVTGPARQPLAAEAVVVRGDSIVAG